MSKQKSIVLLIAVLLLAACGQQSPTFGDVANKPHDHAAEASGAPTDHDMAASTAAGSLQPVVATSEIVVGPNRVALGILENNVPIKDAAQTNVTARFFKLNGNEATAIGQPETARYYGEGLGERGTFIVHPTFDSAGTYGMELQIERPGKQPESQRLSLEVAAKGSAPAIGQDAPRSKTPTTAEVSDLHTISSDANPDPRLHQMSVDQAVSSGKPSLIMFATPGYCQTAVCGPGVDVLQKLADTFGDRIVPVHVEVYELPYDNGKTVPAMSEWGLQTEPWLFLVDRSGKIAERFEGGITFEELEPEVAKLVQ